MTSYLGETQEVEGVYSSGRWVLDTSYWECMALIASAVQDRSGLVELRVGGGAGLVVWASYWHLV